ncbi:hypothetical protein N7513_007288 [Penicillium frequentans]|nr:hypothetical protein N7513_007288 [Penicillium glabrum]
MPEEISEPQGVPAYSLLENLHQEEASELAAQHCGVSIDEIEDIYPCTAAQESLFAFYVARYVYTFAEEVDLDRLKDAVRTTLEAHTILRTRLIYHELYGTLQVVLRNSEITTMANDLHAYLAADCQQRMPPGAPLLRVAIVLDSQGRKQLVLTIHHALYDDWSLNVVLHDIENAYNGKILAQRAFAAFTKISLSALSEASAQEWQSRLEGLSPVQFPRLPTSEYTPAAKQSLVQEVTMPAGLSENQQSALINLAWSLLLSKYTGSTDTVFGVTWTGRRSHLPGIGDMSGPTIATVPFRVQLSSNIKVSEALRSVLETSNEMLPFEQRGLYNISRLGPNAEAACQFQNLIVIQSPPQHQYEYFREITHDLNLGNHATFGTYPITLVCDLRKVGMRVQAVYDDNVVPLIQMQRILNQFKTVIKNLISGPDCPISQVESLSAQDLVELEKWNGQIPPMTDERMHDLILKRCRIQPDALAVASWDGCFTYGEIDTLSGHLALNLIERGIGPEFVVPLYFEKSKYTTVAILAVMRAGAAFVLLDPSNPLARNEEICRRVGATCILSSGSLAASAANFAKECIDVYEGASSLEKQHSAMSPSDIDVSSSNLLYVVFTSGSTGTPKGVQIEHGSFVISTQAYISKSGMNNMCRTLQFASYAFDVSISDTLVTLAAGGCLCVPSEEERKSELAKVVVKYNIDWADLTPSVLRQLQPEDFPSLRTVILGGEPMSRTEIEVWGPHVRLLNVYGPAECCVLSTVCDSVTSTTDPRNIGTGTGCASWIVDPSNHNQLMPIGAIGELLIEGPTVGRGYLADPEKTAASFTSTTPWIKSLRPSQSSTKLYRTGDLVQYTSHGSLRYVGRKDMQVKLRGQRLELEEVEYHISRAFHDSREVVADVITLALDEFPQLVAFLVEDKSEHPDLFIPPTAEFHQSVTTAIAALQSIVPAFMIPSIFLPITHAFRTVSDKVDRRLLREATTCLSREQLQHYRQLHQNGNTEKRKPTSQAGLQMQAIWGQVLGIPAEEICYGDEFFKLGGDSITAMKVASIAKKQGLPISVPDIFQGGSLESVVKSAMSQSAETTSFDWEVETALQSDITKSTRVNDTNTHSQGSKNFVLTGSTGFLGREILQQLVDNPAVKQVHCLAVRSKGSGVGRQSAVFHSSKVVVHQGDISKPHLDIPEQSLSKILEDCQGIIHCAAEISFVKTYDLLKQVNVRPTKYLAKLAIKHRVPIHYMSSAALAHLAVSGTQTFSEVSLRNSPPDASGESGYLCSKWVSEIYLENCSQAYDLPVTIHRISSIIGPGAPEMDITNNVLNFSRKMRAIPDLSSCEQYVDLIDLSLAAGNIIVDAMRADQLSVVSFVHESGQVRVPANLLRGYLEKETGEAISEVALEDWIRVARQCGMPELVAKFLEAMPPGEMDIAMPFLETKRVNGMHSSLLSIEK